VSSTQVISSAGLEEGQDFVHNNFVHASRTKSRSYSNLNAKMLDENLSGEQAPDTLRLTQTATASSLISDF
jgi:hypothetical protein